MIQQLTPRVLVEIRDLDAATEISEVEEGLEKFFKDAVSPEIKIRLSKSVFTGTTKAIVELEEKAAFDFTNAQTPCGLGKMSRSINTGLHDAINGWFWSLRI